MRASTVPPLPDELWISIAGLVSEWRDRAALCLAHPRVGLTSIRSMQAYKDPLLAVAIALWHRSAFYVLTERLFRRYAADSKATEEGCNWLTRAAERHGVALAFELWQINAAKGEWRLAMAMVSGMKLSILSPVVRRVLRDVAVLHYEGSKGAERLVRQVFPDGNVVHFEGEKGKERQVRRVTPRGNVYHFEGETNAERKVRKTFTDGLVCFYEGENGAERTVRKTTSDGRVLFFEGEKGAERLVRKTTPDGRVLFLKARRAPSA